MTAPTDIAILALPHASASTVYGMFDLFRSAGRDWPLVMSGVAGPEPLNPYVVAERCLPFRAGNGVTIAPDYALAACPAPKIVCIPEVQLAPGQSANGLFDAEISWLLEQYRRGCIIATACTGALLLAEAGLLRNQQATTHWAYCDILRDQYPDIRVREQVALVVSGEGRRLVMAGGGTSWLDLALYLIARAVDVETAMQTARIHLLDWHDVGQQPFASLARTRQVDDAVIADCQSWIAGRYELGAPVAAMVERSGLAERTFKRRFQQATGLAPLEYVQVLRLEEAKQMLERDGRPVDDIATDVGYEDARSFGRLFRRRVGLSPAQYRKRFAGLRERLSST